MRWALSVVVVVVAIAVGVAVPGCGAACDRKNESNPPIPFREGTSNGTEYETASAGGPHLFFPGGRRYALVHGLTPPPTAGTISIRLAFAEDGSLADTAGNQVVIQEITEEHVLVKNDTCADFYLYVHARSSGL